MNETFNEFIEKYIESFGNNKFRNDSIDSLKKQYEMYSAEKEAIKILRDRYSYHRIQRKQLMPHHFSYLTTNNETYESNYIDFVFNMDIFNRFGLSAGANKIYVIEGIGTALVNGVNITNIEFFVDDELNCAIAGYQIDKLYYLEAPILVLPHHNLKISVELTSKCENFPLLFIGYKFIGE